MSEAGRISNLLQKAQCCAAKERLAKARAFANTKCCKTPTINSDVPLESTYLGDNVSCYTYVKPPVPPQSVRITQLIKDTLAAEINPLDSNTRFLHYAPTPVIPVCPPISPELFNSDLPRFALSCVLLPNTPLTPSYPF